MTVTVSQGEAEAMGGWGKKVNYLYTEIQT